MIKNVILKVNGMSCGHCVKAVENALAEIGATGKADLESRSVTVEYEADQITLEEIREAILDQGYDVL